MSLIDIAGGATLPKLYRYTGIWPLTAALAGLLAYRVYQKRSRIADMVGGAMAGMGKLPAMALPLIRPSLAKRSQPAKRRTRRRVARKVRVARANSSHAIH